MSMTHIHLGLSLPFASEADRESSEYVIMALLGANCMVNHRYLQKHPDTTRLYDAGITYAVPDQVAEDRLSDAAIERVANLLQKEGAEPHTISIVRRILNGVEEFLDIPALYQRGKGDCNELAPVRIAELWRAGVNASPWLTKLPNERGGLTYHALVRWPDGSSEDPSLILGMGGPKRDADRREEIRKNVERWATHMMAGRHLVESEGVSPVVVGQQIDLMGLIPKDGVFRV